MKRKKRERFDHIAIPNSTLRRFREQGKHTFSYLNMKDMRIYDRGPSTYQKIEGYYRNDFDKVCQRLETFMGKFNKSVADIHNSNMDCAYDKDQLKSLAIDLLALQTMRRPELYKSVMNPAVVIPKINYFESEYARIGRLSYSTVEIANELRGVFATDNRMRNFFYGMPFADMREVFSDKLHFEKFTAIINYIPTEIIATFLLTPFHYIKHGDCYIFTLSPRCAIALIPNNIYQEMGIGDVGITTVADEQNVLCLIPPAIEATDYCENKHLIGERYTLEKAILIMQKDTAGKK